ncbi:MAG: hypothetical protein DSM107014_12570 [Gomphosphaeria aponina SAG 52.96 = DSM 107014]|uniref:3-oxoacyl-ACP synthase n=1 Tax=Gomphosphaeria aponina SAG 52.96 = DSM 107014 TaxID=1521640 RepID=A0A941GYL9_9CHRO|nr:hypothetical protein [Gomphosphaeria aponina SAG 52.96 = DSM 107014]
MSKEERQKALFEMSDEDIDFSDIPELDETFLENAKRVENTIVVKDDVINWFKNHAKGKNYKVLINDVLENYIEHQVES